MQQPLLGARSHTEVQILAIKFVANATANKHQTLLDKETGVLYSLQAPIVALDG